MKIAIICTVRNASEEYKGNLYKYAEELEEMGHTVHLPDRDTDQDVRGLDICESNLAAINNADEVHVFYNPDSQGTHFDLGVAFALNKTIKIIENVSYGVGKSFPRMLDEWVEAL